MLEAGTRVSRAYKEKGSSSDGLLQIILPGHSDYNSIRDTLRTCYNDFIDAGYEIIEYNGLTHHKIIVVDHEYSYVGTGDLMSMIQKLDSGVVIKDENLVGAEL